MVILVEAQGSSILEMRCLAAVDGERQRQETVNSVTLDQESQNRCFIHGRTAQCSKHRRYRGAQGCPVHLYGLSPIRMYRPHIPIRSLHTTVHAQASYCTKWPQMHVLAAWGYQA